MNTKDHFDIYLASEFVGRAPATLRNHTAALKAFQVFLDNRAIDADTYSDWVKYASQRWSSQTVSNIVLASTRRFLVWLERHRLIEMSPHRLVRAPLPERHETRKPFTPEEYRSLLLVSADPIRWAILLGWHTGMAIGDASLLQWSEVNMQTYVISRRRLKTDEPCTIPFSHELAEEFRPLERSDEWPNQPDKGISFVCPGLAALYMRGQGSAQRAFAEAREKAGVSKDKSFHNLRATFCTDLVKNGVDHVIASQMTGHKNPAIFRQYVTADADRIRTALVGIR